MSLRDLIRPLLDYTFGKAEEINGAELCPTYLYRWAVWRGENSAVYLHQFTGDDWARDLHDHPKAFVSLGLRGGYIEETPAGVKTFRAPWLRWFPPEHAHRLELLPGKPCWTLVWVGRKVRDWGFFMDRTKEFPGLPIEWVQWKRYVMSYGIERKAC